MDHTQIHPSPPQTPSGGAPGRGPNGASQWGPLNGLDGAEAGNKGVPLDHLLIRSVQT